MELCDWKSRDEDQPLRAGISSFGFGGVNSYIMVESFNKNSNIEINSKINLLADNFKIFIPSAKLENVLKNLLLHGGNLYIKMDSKN